MFANVNASDLYLNVILYVAVKRGVNGAAGAGDGKTDGKTEWAVVEE